MDQRYEANQGARRRFKLRVIEFGCKLDAIGCGLAPHLSEMHRQHLNELTGIGCGLVVMVLLIQGYFLILDRM